jgi:hypothetical protein
MDQYYKKKLVSARNDNKVFKNVPKTSPLAIAKAGTQEIKIAFSLSAQLDPLLDWLYGIALALAILKDILDLVGIGSLPAIGTAVTLMISFCIGFVMLITGSRKMTKAARGIIKRLGVLIGGTVIEMLFGINFLPVETLVVIIVFYMTLRERALNAKSIEAITHSQV